MNDPEKLVEKRALILFQRLVNNHATAWEEAFRLAHVALTRSELQEWILNLLSGVEVVPTGLEDAKRSWQWQCDAEERR